MLGSEYTRRCVICGAVYDWRKSTSRYLRMTVDSYTCERKLNGCLIEDFDGVYSKLGRGFEPELTTEEQQQLSEAVTDILTRPRTRATT